MLNEIIHFRKTLHQYPELSGQESNTAQRIKAFVEKHHPSEIIENISGAGIAVIYSSTNPGPSVMIRCELDALPIEELNDFDHKSTNEGISHKCGHDGHMSIVAGLIFEIKKRPIEKGTVILLFQPAEETGQGAAAMLNDPKFRDLKPDYIFALHNIPGEDLNKVILVNELFSPAVISFAISFSGKEAHASEPENGVNPALVIADTIKGFDLLMVTDPFRKDFTLLTPVYIKMGQKAYGISAGSGTLHYTLRTWSDEHLEKLKPQIKSILLENCKANALSFKIDWFEHFPSTRNDQYCNTVIREAAIELDLSIVDKPYPFKFGEDFGRFSKDHKVAMFGLGAGKQSPALHHAEYDFNDELIPTGIKLFDTIIRKILL